MIHFIIGTRAQLIKIAPLMIECKKRGINYNFIFLSQHKNTIYEIIDMFGIKRPDIVLGDIGKDITNAKTMVKWSLKVLFKAIINRKKIFKGDENGIAIVHGDAPPVLLGAIIAKIAGLKVAHVEAGLRSFNFLHPFPEELTRVLTWKLRLVDFYFCPNQWALSNVERYRGQKYDTKSNTLFDSFQIALKFMSKIEVNVPQEKYAIVTLHRFETILKRKKCKEIIEILIPIANKIKLLFILHPPTAAALRKYDFYKILECNPNIELRPRYSYFQFIKLLINSEFVISDGGSNQEECFYFGHPCLLLRYKTERVEGLNKNAILSKLNQHVINEFLSNYNKYRHSPIQKKYSPSKMIINELNSHMLCNR